MRRCSLLACSTLAATAAAIRCSGIDIRMLSDSSFLGVAIPPLPSGESLSILEGLNLVDDATAAEEELADLLSVGGTMWPCAAALCQWLSASQAEVQGASVLELGGGTGACGLFAAGLGASRVLLTDGSAGLLTLQAQNLQANAALLPEGAHVEVQQLLWDRTPPPPGPWDLVIGSDVTFMYDPEAHAALAATLGAMLRSPDPLTTAAPPRVLLAHEHRNRGPGDAPARWDANDETLRRFQAAAREHALRVEQLRAERVGTHQVSIIEVLREE